MNNMNLKAKICFVTAGSLEISAVMLLIFGGIWGSWISLYSFMFGLYFMLEGVDQDQKSTQRK